MVVTRTDLRHLIDVALERFLASQRDHLDEGAHPLLDEIGAVVAAGGKRLRPTFCFWGYRATGAAPSDEIVAASAALELVHTFALIHDDVMDRSEVRRGRPATWKAFAGASQGGRSDPQQMGVAAAVLTGDLALVLADRLLASSGFASDVLARARLRFDSMRAAAIAGQMLDLDAAHLGRVTEGEARRIATLKSGGYTVAYPLSIGADLGGDDPDVQRVLAGYGSPLGQAFQLRDDVLGVFGDPSITGKERDGDLREGKQTVLVARARATGTAAQVALLDRALGRPDLTPDDADRLREVLRETGALDHTLGLIADLAAEARAALDAAVIGSEVADALTELAQDVSEREA
ncbi:MAG TPA: polyprenyl synthetase family protein [Actinomycetota bacterium]|nr:polyprenyl synthetase family protein [Actinomycetota bacterium]